MIKKIIYETMKFTSREIEQGVVLVIESCKLHRGQLILKRELTNKLEEAFPEK